MTRDAAPPPDPPREPVDVARHWVQDSIRRRLKAEHVQPNLLAARLGGGEGNWRNKLSGSRPFRLDDVIAIVMAVDAQLLEAIGLTSGDLRELFPPEYRERLSHTVAGQSMPTFVSNGDWVAVAEHLASWLVAEAEAGRGWLIDHRGLARMLLELSGTANHPSTAASVAGSTDTTVQIEWISQDTVMQVGTSRSAEATPTSATIRTANAAIAHAIKELSDHGASHKHLVWMAQNHAIENFLTVTNLAIASETGDSRGGSWQALSPQALHRLSQLEAGAELPSDILVRPLACTPRQQLIWIQVK